MPRGVRVTMPCPEVFLIVFAPCSGLVVRLLLSVWFFCHMDDGAANTYDIFVDPTTVRLLGLQFCQTFLIVVMVNCGDGGSHARFTKGSISSSITQA